MQASSRRSLANEAVSFNHQFDRERLTMRRIAPYLILLPQIKAAGRIKAGHYLSPSNKSDANFFANALLKFAPLQVDAGSGEDS